MKMDTKVTLMDCLTLNEVDHALNASWSGFPVRAIWKGKTYDLYLDTEANETNAHEDLMEDSNVMAPANINLTKSKDWKRFEEYPMIEVEPFPEL